MKLNIQIDGLQDTLALLDGFSPRRMNAGLATALTRSAKQISLDWQAQIDSRIDRPNPRTQKAATFKGATAARLEAEVFVKTDQGAKGVSPAEYLGPQEAGGSRLVKKFERALQRSGAMVAGRKVVPAAHAKLDAYGNISRGQIVQVIAQLGHDFSPGYARVIAKSVQKRIAKARKSGTEYVAFPQRQGRIKPGVYIRQGRLLLPVFWYVSVVSYRKRLDLVGEGARLAPAEMERQVTLALNQQIQKLAAKRAGGSAP